MEKKNNIHPYQMKWKLNFVFTTKMLFNCTQNKRTNCPFLVRIRLDDGLALKILIYSDASIEYLPK